MQVIDDGYDLPASNAGTAKNTLTPLCAAAAPMGKPGLEDLAISLPLGDLLPDANGEVVIVSVGAEAGLSIVTDERICGAGMADSHVTADGFDVGGFAFCAFESGTTLYYSPDLNLTIAQTEAY